MAYTFSLRDMLRKFGVVTVMDVDVYAAHRFESDVENSSDYEGNWDAKTTLAADKLFRLKSLKITNINQEGPTKTITGGMNADKLLKYGKTYTIEMQEALGSMNIMEHIYGANVSANDQFVAFTDGFPGELTLVGKTFVVDQKTGAKQPIRVVIPIFLADGIFNLTMDAEGDATVFDLNGDILAFDTSAIASEAVGTENGQKLYKKGSDNQFYFFATEEGFEKVKEVGYEEAKTDVAE